MVCESCASDQGLGGTCNACGQSCGDHLCGTPDPGWCMTPEEEFQSRVDRGMELPQSLLDQVLRD